MVTGCIVNYDSTSDTYHLPPQHAASLTRTATPANMAKFMQHIPLPGRVEDGIVACLRHGGSVPL
jgi:hypothetical protein